MTFRPPTVSFRDPLLAVCVMVLATAASAARGEGDAPHAGSRQPVATPARALTPGQTAATVGALPVDAQVAWLQRAARRGDLEKLDDAQLIALFSSLDPLTLPCYIAAGPNGYESYEFTMRRRERIRGQWPAKPDHMLVRIAHDPLRIYAKWLPDGGHAGQEVLYDASVRRNELYGHLGGLLNKVSIWTSIDGLLARAQSRHRITDLGTEYIARHFLSEGERAAQTGIAQTPRVGVETVDGVRVVTFTYTTPPGTRGSYASRETLGLDLRHPWFRIARSYDSDGRPFEDVVFEHIEPMTFDASTFDPKNPDYRF
jgi:hypothetical protein